MDPNTMRILGNEYHESIIKDADAARMMRLPGTKRRQRSGPRVAGLRASQVGIAGAVDHSLSEMLRCRWNRAQQDVERLRSKSAASSAAVAVSALINRLTRTDESAHDSVIALSSALDLATTNPHTWAAATAAMALEDWVIGSTVDDGGSAWNEIHAATAPQSRGFVGEMCVRARALGDNARDILCLSLALHARKDGDQVLGSFILGQLSGATSPAGRAAVGLSLHTLGDIEAGRDILLGVLNSPDTFRMPLVEGLLEAEMARVDHENGNEPAAHVWADRAMRFTNRYHCPLPAEAVRAAS